MKPISDASQHLLGKPKPVVLITRPDDASYSIPQPSISQNAILPNESPDSIVWKKSYTPTAALKEQAPKMSKKYGSESSVGLAVDYNNNTFSAAPPDSSKLLLSDDNNPMRSRLVRNQVPKYPFPGVPLSPSPMELVKELSEIFTELGSITQGLASDFPLCRKYSDAEPQLLEYVNTLQSYIISFNQVAQDVSGIHTMIRSQTYAPSRYNNITRSERFTYYPNNDDNNDPK